MVTYYESDRFALVSATLPSLAGARSRYGGSLYSILGMKCDLTSDTSLDIVAAFEPQTIPLLIVVKTYFKTKLSS